MERLTVLLTQSRMFQYFQGSANLHNKLRKAVYGIAMERLLEDLTPSQKKILKHKHWHSSDPNFPEDGRKISLLERLINDACFSGMNSGIIETQLFIPSLEDMTGIKRKESVAKKIEAINKIWGGYASLFYKDDYLFFEINLLQN